MKVLMFGWEFPPYYNGGLGIACAGISGGLLKSGVRMKFVVPSGGAAIDPADGMEIIDAGRVPGLEPWENCKGFAGAQGACQRANEEPEGGRVAEISPYYPHYRAEILSDHSSRGGVQGCGSFAIAGNYDLDLGAEVRRYGRIGGFLGLTGDFDIIHCHDWLTYPAGLAAKNVSKRPLVVHVHATEIDRSGENPDPYIFSLEKNAMELADRIVAVSRYTANTIISYYAIDPDKINIVYNAVDSINAFNAFGKTGERLIQHKPRTVLFLGRITGQKGPGYFLEAADIVRQRMNDIRFVMAGNGDLLAEMILRAAKLRMAGCFHFTGFLDRESVCKILRMSDLLVMPSVSEPFGITALEAISSGVSVLLSKQSGVAEILKSAPVADFWDTGKIADSIVTLLEDPDLRKRIVRECGKEMRELSWARAGEELHDIYRQIA